MANVGSKVTFPRNRVSKVCLRFPPGMDFFANASRPTWPATGLARRYAHLPLTVWLLAFLLGLGATDGLAVEGQIPHMLDVDVELPSGKLVPVSRTQYANFPLYQSISRDKSRTWKVDRNGLTGLCPALCFTQCGPLEGILTLIYHDRWGKHASDGGIYAVFSTDEGDTWGEPVRMDHGAYPCLIEVAPGQMFTTYYRGFDLLRGGFFSVPFPSGLRARRTTDSATKVEIAWDAYRGKKAADYTYHVHRSNRPDFPLTKETLIGSVQDTNSFVDKEPETQKKHFYRVVAHDGQNRVGRSWVACAATAER